MYRSNYTKPGAPAKLRWAGVQTEVESKDEASVLFLLFDVKRCMLFNNHNIFNTSGIVQSKYPIFNHV
jgi:hypothetical protein